MRKTFIVLISIVPLLLLSQNRDKRSAPYTIRYNIGIPKTISSKMFRTAFNGIFETNLSMNLRLFSNFFGGIGYQYSHFQNNKEVFTYYRALDPNGKPTGATLSYNTRMVSNFGFLKIGYDQFFEKGFATFALNAGYGPVHYKNVVTDTTAVNLPLVSTLFNASYLQPEISVSFIADRSLTFSLLFSYTTMLYKFNPKAPQFYGFGEVREKSNRYVMSWVNIGFGVTILLGKR